MLIFIFLNKCSRSHYKTRRCAMLRVRNLQFRLTSLWKLRIRNLRFWLTSLPVILQSGFEYVLLNIQFVLLVGHLALRQRNKNLYLWCLHRLFVFRIRYYLPSILQSFVSVTVLCLRVILAFYPTIWMRH